MEIIKQAKDKSESESLNFNKIFKYFSYLYKNRKTTDLDFEKEILSHVHNMELSIEKLLQNNLMKKASLKEFHNFKQNFSNPKRHNNNFNKKNFSENLNFTCMKIFEFGKIFNFI